MPIFCRHNRFEANCPICSKEKAPAARRSSSGSGRTARPGRPGSVPRRSDGAGQRGSRVVTRRLERPAEDGYSCQLIPGVHASLDAERLAACLAFAAERLDFPGPYPAVAELGESDLEAGTWLAFLLALAGPDRPELQDAIAAARPAVDADPGESGLGADAQRTITAYKAWVARFGSQQAAIGGDPHWTPQRRFQRTFERLALPGFARAQRYEFLATLAAAGLYDLRADALHVAMAHDDPTVIAAKRALVSGDAMLLERRAAELAERTGVPIAALDRGLALWDRTDPVEAPEGPRLEAARHALRLV